MKYIIEAIYWFLIFLSPLLASVLIAVILFYFTSMLIISAILIVLGISAGVWFAEWARLKYGCSHFFTRGNRVIEMVKKEDEN